MQGRLEAALLMVQDLSDQERVEGTVHHGSERYWGFMEPLHLAQGWAITPQAAETWVKVAVEHPGLQHTLRFVLRAIDHPDAIETFVRWSAARGGTFWDEAFESFDPLAPVDVPKMPVNASTRTRLWTIFEHDADRTTQEIAFRFWKRTVAESDLEQLRRISINHPFFEETLKVRLKLRDKTATNLLIERMKSDPGLWCGYAPLFYEEKAVREALLNHLEIALNTSQLRADAIPQHLPAEGLRELLRSKGDLLRRSPSTWPFLWRSEVPEALVFVREVISQADAAKTPVATS